MTQPNTIRELFEQCGQPIPQFDYNFGYKNPTQDLSISFYTCNGVFYVEIMDKQEDCPILNPKDDKSYRAYRQSIWSEDEDAVCIQDLFHVEVSLDIPINLICWDNCSPDDFAKICAKQYVHFNPMSNEEP